MRVELTVRDGVASPLTTAECERVLSAALRAAGAPDDAIVGLTLSDDEELGSLNASHMGASGPTDVLSFPFLPPDAFPPHDGQARLGTVDRADPPPAFVLPPGEPVHLGDIAVSVERALAQAEDGRGGQAGDTRWSGAEELRLLIVHGALHLCGWDHAEPVEEAAMRALERRILAAGR